MKKKIANCSALVVLLTSFSASAKTNDSPLLQSQLNQPNGVAGLNASGKIFAPLETQGDIRVDGKTSLGKLYSGQPAIMQGVSPTIDGALARSSILLGGVGKDDFAPVKITSPLIGSSDFGGCVLSVNDSPFEQFSRCGTGYDESIGLMEKVQNRAPRLSLGADVSGSSKAPSDVNYSVSYGGHFIKIRPSLDARDAALLISHIRVYSNFENGMVSTIAAGSHDSPSLWYGYIWRWFDGKDDQGSFTTVEVSTSPYNNSGGWVRNTSQFTSVTTTIALGKNPGDTIDTYISNYAHPAAFVGQVGKKFVVNSMIQLDANVENSPTLSAEGEELDLQLLDTAWFAHEKKFTVHGKTIVLTGMDHPADDSYLELLAGTNLIKRGLWINGIVYGGQTSFYG